MAIINNDIMTTPDGFSVTGAYISVGSNELKVYKDENGNFLIDFTVTIWKDKSWHDGGNRPFKTIGYIQKPVTNIDQSVYTTAYSYIKSDFPNYTNAES